MKKNNRCFAKPQGSVKRVSFGLVQLTVRAMRDILLEMTAEFPYIHRKHDPIINLVKTSMTLSIMCKFENFFFQCFWDIKAFSAVVFIYIINETVSVLEAQSFWNWWIVFRVLWIDEFENAFLLFVILVNLFESCLEIVCHFYENYIINGEKLVFNDWENMVNVENTFRNRRRRQKCFFWTNETRRRVLYAAFPACALHLTRMGKNKWKHERNGN